MLDDDRHIRTVEVGRHVGAHHAERGHSLQPDVADDPAVVPPVGKAPRDDVVAGPPLRIVDADREAVVGAWNQRRRGVEREGRIAPFVVAEVLAVEPDVSDVANRTELQERVLAAEGGRDEEVMSVETAGDAAVGRRVERAWDSDRRPGCIVIDGSGPLTELRREIAQRALPIGEAGGYVQLLRIEAPCAIEVHNQTGLPVESGYGLAGLERDDTPRLVLQGERRSEIGLSRRRNEAARCGRQRKHQRTGEDDRSPACGHHRLQGTRARLFGCPAPH